MSVSGKKARNLELYRLNLEQRVEQGDWSLVCRDEKLCQQVAGLLRDGWSQDMNPFPGLDPLQVMEDSLKTATPTPGRARERTGLSGLERAFEVLELAALNLYLCPWRKEYRVVKMFSGMFTHYVKPSLSRPQVLQLFGLLGYQAGEARKSEELCLRAPGLPLDSLLSVACAFFMARCECHLLLEAFRKHTGARSGAGAADWELNLVQERQRGHSLEVALENTKRKLDSVPPREVLLGASALESDLDLYTAEGPERNRGHGETVLGAEGPRSPTWVARSTSKSPPSVRRDNNGVPAPREAVCVSTLNYQLTRSLPFASANNTSATKLRESCYGEMTRPDSVSLSLTARLNNRTDASPEDSLCGCMKSVCMKNLFVQRCGTCDALHRMDCPVLLQCLAEEHDVGVPFDDDSPLQEQRESRGAELQRGRSLREGGASAASPPPSPLRQDETQSSVLRDFPGSPGRSLVPQPIPLHECCDTASPDPHLVCFSCRVFHVSTCKNVEFCQRKHQIHLLGLCTTEGCLKPPHVLCRHCGAEFCKNCWYRRPLHCACGQPFDQSSSV